MFIVRHKTGSWLHIHSSEFAVYECDEHPLAKWRDTDTLLLVYAYNIMNAIF